MHCIHLPPQQVTALNLVNRCAADRDDIAKLAPCTLAIMLHLSTLRGWHDRHMLHRAFQCVSCLQACYKPDCYAGRSHYGFRDGGIGVELQQSLMLACQPDGASLCILFVHERPILIWSLQ